MTAHYVNEMGSHIFQARVFNEPHTGVKLPVLLHDVLLDEYTEKNPALLTYARNMLVDGAGTESTMSNATHLILLLPLPVTHSLTH